MSVQLTSAIIAAEATDRSFLIGGCVAIKGGIYKGKKGRVCRIEGMWGQTVIVEVPGDGKVFGLSGPF